MNNCKTVYSFLADLDPPHVFFCECVYMRKFLFNSWHSIQIFHIHLMYHNIHHSLFFVKKCEIWNFFSYDNIFRIGLQVGNSHKNTPSRFILKELHTWVETCQINLIKVSCKLRPVNGTQNYLDWYWTDELNALSY